jgi:hypothetical protein
MHFLLTNARWLTGLLIQFFVAFLAFRRGYLRTLPVFAVYLGALALLQLLYLGLTVTEGLRSPVTFWTYWGTQAIFVALRGAVVAELARWILSPYEGVWAFARLVLLAVTGLLLALAVFDAYHSQHSVITFITALDRDLNFAIISTLGVAILFARYYEIRVDRAVILIAIGLMVYSSITMANSHILATWLKSYFAVWSEIQLDSFLIGLTFWAVAVWKPMTARARPVMLAPAAYGELIPAMNFQLRQLNGRLSEMLR